MVLLASAGLGWFVFHRFIAPAPQFSERQLTTNSSESPISAAAISPDGRYLAYTAGSGIDLKLIDSGEVHAISAPAGSDISGLSWFPDRTKLLASGTVGNSDRTSLSRAFLRSRDLGPENTAPIAAAAPSQRTDPRRMRRHHCSGLESASEPRRRLRRRKARG
jgi:hypothetical protein